MLAGCKSVAISLGAGKGVGDSMIFAGCRSNETLAPLGASKGCELWVGWGCVKEGGWECVERVCGGGRKGEEELEVLEWMGDGVGV